MVGDVLQILFVEDHRGDVEFVGEALKDAPGAKFQLTHATRLDEAFSRLEGRAFDAVLLDLGLPDSQGLDTFPGCMPAFLEFQ